MRDQFKALWTFVCGLMVGVGVVTAHAAYVDPLDVPSLPSSLAEYTNLIDVAKAPCCHWVAVGRRGHILLSDDAKTWRQSPIVPVSTDLVAVSFIDASHGWAVGHSGVILATTDGGKNWTKQMDGRQAATLLVKYYEALAAASPKDAEIAFLLSDAKHIQENGAWRPFLDIKFTDLRRGYAVGAYNLLFVTVDGGASWTPQPHRLANPKELHLNGIRAIGNDVYIAGEQGLLARLNPATGNFDVLKTTYAGSFFGLTGKDGLLVLFGLQGNVFRTTDRGVTWQKLDTGLAGTISSGTMLDDGRLVLASQNGRLAVSSDNGDHFTAITPVVPGNIYSIAAGPGNRAVLVGSRGVRTETLK